MYERSRVIDNIKLLIDEDNEKLVKLLTNKAESTVRAVCNVEEITSEMEDVIEDIACFRYNQLGREGITSDSMGRNSVSVEDNFPDYITIKLRGFTRVPRSALS